MVRYEVLWKCNFQSVADKTVKFSAHNAGSFWVAWMDLEEGHKSLLSECYSCREFPVKLNLMKLRIYENHIKLWELQGEELYERRSSRLQSISWEPKIWVYGSLEGNSRNMSHINLWLLSTTKMHDSKDKTVGFTLKIEI